MYTRIVRTWYLRSTLNRRLIIERRPLDLKNIDSKLLGMFFCHPVSTIRAQGNQLSTLRDTGKEANNKRKEKRCTNLEWWLKRVINILSARDRFVQKMTQNEFVPWKKRNTGNSNFFTFLLEYVFWSSLSNFYPHEVSCTCTCFVWYFHWRAKWSLTDWSKKLFKTTFLITVQIRADGQITWHLAQSEAFYLCQNKNCPSGGRHVSALPEGKFDKNAHNNLYQRY